MGTEGTASLPAEATEKLNYLIRVEGHKVASFSLVAGRGAGDRGTGAQGSGVVITDQLPSVHLSHGLVGTWGVPPARLAH